MRIASLLLLIFGLAGCKSTPYDDDYAKHHNSLNSSDKTKTFVFSVANDPIIDLRGSYKKDDSVDNSSVLYASDAGLVGMLLQVGIHTASINAQRNERLTQAQTIANEQIPLLIEKSKTLKLNNLIGDYQPLFANSPNSDSTTVHVKPIFFSNAKKNNLHMRMVAWIHQSTTKQTQKPQFKYKNSIQVFGKKLSEEETAMLVANDSDFLETQLSELMRVGIFVLNKDVKGLIDAKLKADKPPSKTYLIGSDSPIVYRGKLVQEHCNFSIIKDLHSWLIAFPTATVDESGNRALGV